MTHWPQCTERWVDMAQWPTDPNPWRWFVAFRLLMETWHFTFSHFKIAVYTTHWLLLGRRCFNFQLLKEMFQLSTPIVIAYIDFWVKIFRGYWWCRLRIVFWNFLKYVWTKKYVGMCIMLFKMWKYEFELTHQIGP